MMKQGARGYYERGLLKAALPSMLFKEFSNFLEGAHPAKWYHRLFVLPLLKMQLAENERCYFSFKEFRGRKYVIKQSYKLPRIEGDKITFIRYGRFQIDDILTAMTKPKTKEKK